MERPKGRSPDDPYELIEVTPKINGEPVSALEYIQDIYKGKRVFDPQRFRAAKEALAYESPRLAVVAALGDDQSLAERLEKALVRSGVKLINEQTDIKK